MLFKPDPADSAGLIVNYKCTNSCVHCLYASSPSVEEDVSFDSLARIVREIRQNIPRCSIHIGGGEPLLGFDILCRAVEEISSSGIHLEYVETNGRLLTSGNARSMLEGLRSAGLRCMLLSISPFHNAYISVDENKSVFDLITSIFGNHGIFPWHPNYYRLMESIETYRRLSQ